LKHRFFSFGKRLTPPKGVAFSSLENLGMKSGLKYIMVRVTENRYKKTWKQNGFKGEKGAGDRFLRIRGRRF